MKNLRYLQLQWLSLALFLGANLTVLAQSPTTRLTGIYQGSRGEFKVLALSENQLQLEFLGFYEYSTPQGPMAHIGTARGLARLSELIAVFKPKGTQDCILTLEFQSEGVLVVKQQGSDGDCGFGHNVTAEGTYTQVSHSTPIFDSDSHLDPPGSKMGKIHP